MPAADGSFAPPPDGRPRFEFTFDEVDRLYETDPHAITLVPIRVSDQIEANEIGRGNGATVAMELMRRSVVEIDGKPVNWEGAGPEWLEKANPKIRSLVEDAYKAVNLPADGRPAAFLAGVKVKRPSSSG